MNLAVLLPTLAAILAVALSLHHGLHILETHIMATQADVQALADRLAAIVAQPGPTPSDLDLTPIANEVAALEAKFPPGAGASA